MKNDIFICDNDIFMAENNISMHEVESFCTQKCSFMEFSSMDPCKEISLSFMKISFSCMEMKFVMHEIFMPGFFHA